MKNFDYILQVAEHVPGFKRLHEYCDMAESLQTTFPEASANSARKALEWLVKNMLKMKGAELDDRTMLNEMLHKPEMYAFVNHDYNLDDDIRLVQKIGNSASHDGAEPVKRVKAFRCLRALYNVVAGFMYRWGAMKEIPPFDATLVPATIGGPVLTTSPEPQVEQDVVESVPVENVEHPQSPDIPRESLESEAITRKYLIDYMLIEAGWDILEVKGDVQGGKACIEVEVEGMPTPSGKGYADYVLMSRGGKPLAVIEAKSTTHEVGEGRRQAMLYAELLEQKYGVRPVIYYTNGFETMVIDGMGYMDRPVYGFHSMDDLERLIQKRGRSEIRDLRINDAITNRPYQQTAIKSIVEWLNMKHRRGLLVLATGTGKTRVSISLCDILMRNDWVKNVLFLADRTALVNQAHKNYEALLPDVSMSVLSEEKEPDMQARIMFSTYQTMINYIDKDEKKFSVGRFDLIIIDEAHRSVFGRYGSIFKYFDSLLIGLTATPRDEIDRSTYELLQMDNGAPNFSYDLEEAVADGYLIPYETLQYHSKIMEQGIKWDDLPKDQQDRLDEVFTYERVLAGLPDDEEYHRDIDSKEIFNYLINTDTIDKVLQELMEKGLKVQSGEEIGKTIIFAMNHFHAEQIVKRFRELYPEKGEKYCQLIDNYVKYANALILDFGEPEKLPQIAVSVDMLDTGVDVPSILNLVFFKRVKSKIKFMQMIGRGTRLWNPTPALPEREGVKTKFYIFDWCNNFEYFNVHADGAEPVVSKSLTEKLFCMRLDIALALQSAEHQEREEDKRLHDELKEMLHAQIDSLSMARIDVREKMSSIEPYRDKEAWVCLTEVDVAKLRSIASLLPRPNENEAAKKFDVLMLQLQLEKVDSTVNADKARSSVITLAQMLEEKASIPLVKSRMNTIREVQTVEFWESVAIDRLEKVRKELRDLIQLLEGQRNDRKFIINIEDTTSSDADAARVQLRATYKQRVIDYLANNTGNPTLMKIQNLEQLTADDVEELQRIFWEELGTREEFDELTVGKRYRNNVASFIRVINGIDRKKALAKYAEFIKGTNLSAEQEQYLKNILDFISVNGDIQVSDFMGYPLKLYRWRDVFGNHFVSLKDFVKEVHQVIEV
ncbi:MAG: DEAD/DEAH box helicase family protein, partial [Prevotellaceae bacterium]|nr:DEAD/DEAH box helicase family protein [Candidatus Minthosoma caballi]